MVKAPNKAIKQENLQLAVFTAFNILASYKFPLIEALGGTTFRFLLLTNLCIFKVGLVVIQFRGFSPKLL
jgi:hypothetical protein